MPVRTATLFGTPAFVYRDLWGHVVGWLSSVAGFRRNDAFYHETRVLYFASYIWNRYRREGGTLWAIPFQLWRCAASVIQHRIQRRAKVNVSGGA